DVFLDLFAYGNQGLTENKEALWVIQFEPLVTGGSSYPGERGWGPAYFRMGNTPDGFPAFRGEFVDGRYTGYSDTLVVRSPGSNRPTTWPMTFGKTIGTMISEMPNTTLSEISILI